MLLIFAMILNCYHCICSGTFIEGVRMEDKAIMSTHALIVKELQMEEGFRSKPYEDTQGHWTIGLWSGI